MPPHILVVFFVAAIWATAQVAIEGLLRDLRPLLATALCFFFAAFPALLVIKPPKTPLRRLVLFGPFMFIGHLGFPFSTVYAGLTSLILSVHAFITIALAILFLGERPSVFQLIWAGLA